MSSIAKKSIVDRNLDNLIGIVIRVGDAMYKWCENEAAKLVYLEKHIQQN